MSTNQQVYISAKVLRVNFSLQWNQFKRTSSGIFFHLPGWSVMQSERTSSFGSTTFFMVDSSTLDDLREGKQMSHKVGVHFPELHFMFLSWDIPSSGNQQTECFQRASQEQLFCYISWHLVIYWKYWIMHNFTSFCHCAGLGKKSTPVESK